MGGNNNSGQNSSRNSNNNNQSRTITCYICNKKGHTSYQYLDKDSSGTNATGHTQGESGTVMLISGIVAETEHRFLMHLHHNNIDKDWILLDSKSTIDILCNKRLLTNIIEATTTTIH